MISGPGFSLGPARITDRAAPPPPFGQAPGAGAAIALGAYNSFRKSLLQLSPG